LQTYTDQTVARLTVYYYRVVAHNEVGSKVPGYPSVSLDSPPSNVAMVTTLAPEWLPVIPKMYP